MEKKECSATRLDASGFIGVCISDGSSTLQTIVSTTTKIFKLLRDGDCRAHVKLQFIIQGVGYEESKFGEYSLVLCHVLDDFRMILKRF